ncbi:MAG TPA: LLM class flavin-dependent oxidoreductase [Actinomycetes bacterium]|nr:LLM class flavin-dependent oxidoreductase [Actinomycetes bacterium]
MRFGLFYLHQVPRPWSAGREERVLREALEQVELADRLGFDHVWAAEHHFLDEYSHSSAPEIFLAAAAARTTNIRLAHGIVTLPPGVNHPARVAERIATLDLISGGRVDFGSGLGSSHYELDMFGVAGTTKREQWREAVEVVARMLTEVPFTGHKGAFLDLPPRNVLPKPKQQPHPPMWVACGAPTTVERAALNGLGALSFSFMTPEQAKERVDTYYRLLMSDECVPAARAVNANFATVLPLMCHADEQTAYDRATSGIDFYVNAFMHYYVRGRHRPGTTDLRAAFQHQGPIAKQVRDHMDLVVHRAVGTPAKIAAEIRAQEAAEVDQIIFQVNLGDTRHEHVCESLELFAREVMPEFAERREAREKAKHDRLAEAIQKALTRIEPYTADISAYETKAEMEQNPPQGPS